MSKKTELKAAAARLLYNSNRNTSDYDLLVDFIDSHFDYVEAVVRELEEKSMMYSLNDRDCIFAIPLNDAIEIVKRGGRNDSNT